MVVAAVVYNTSDHCPLPDAAAAVCGKSFSKPPPADVCENTNNNERLFVSA